MTVSEEEKPFYNRYGDGVNTQFDFDFYIQNETQIKVTLLNSVLQPEYGRDYEIVGIKNPDGGHVIFPIEGSEFSILGEGEVISLTQELPIAQPKPYPESENLKMKNIEDGLDYLTRIAKILDRKIERSVKTKEGSEQSADELMNRLEQAQINALESANTSANSATDASNKANIATEQAEIATEKVEEIQEISTTALSDINDSKENALSDIDTSKSEAIEIIEEKSRFSTRNMLELVYSFAPLNDAALHVPDGSILYGGGTYDGCVKYARDLKETEPDLFTTELDWQTQVSTNGKCGKFVYHPAVDIVDIDLGAYQVTDSDSNIYYTLSAPTTDDSTTEVIPSDTILYDEYGVESLTVTTESFNYTGETLAAWTDYPYPTTGEYLRLPLVDGFFEVTLDKTKIGDFTEAGLPDVWFTYGSLGNEYLWQLSSGFSRADYSNGRVTETSKSTNNTLTFKMSRQNPIYKENFNKVQVESIKIYCYIVIGTVAKTDVLINLDNIATDLNNKADKSELDGKWTSKFIEGFSSVTAIGSYELDLSDYLPNDNSLYKVAFLAECARNDNSGADSIYALSTNFYESAFTILNCDGSNWQSDKYTGEIIVPQDRIMTINITNYALNYSKLSLLAYKKLGK